MYRSIIIGLMLLATNNLVLSQSILADAHETFSGIRNLEVKGGFCNVSIIGNEDNKTEFQGEIKGKGPAKGFSIRHERKNDQLIVWVETPKMSWSNVNGSLQFWVPRECNVSVSNGSGSIKVSDLKYGELKLESGSGSMHLANMMTNTRIKGSSGSVNIDRHEGNIDVATSSGSLKIAGATGDLVARTSSGSIDIKDSKGNVQAEASSGGIHIANTQGTLNLKTSSGSINGREVSLSNSSSFNSSSGSIFMDIENDINSLNFKLSAGSGSITINGERKPKSYLKSGDGNLLINGNSSSGSQTYIARKKSI